MSFIDEDEKVAAKRCLRCPRHNEGTCMWGGFVGDCPLLPSDEWHHQERMNEDQKEEEHWHKES